MAPPPPQSAILGAYAVLGSALSFVVGRKPGTLPEDLLAELWLPVAAVCLFVPLYSVFDVMGAGIPKGALLAKKSSEKGVDLPEAVLLAQRAQTNQVEQLPGFLAATFYFSLFVNGTVGGILALCWVVLRVMYSQAYRASVGVAFDDKGLIKYTIPCYFMLNAMSTATLIHMLRYAMGTSIASA